MLCVNNDTATTDIIQLSFRYIAFKKMFRFLLFTLPLLAQGFQMQPLLSQRAPITTTLAMASGMNDNGTVFKIPVSRRDAVNIAASGSLIAACLASGASPAMAADIRQQMQALEREFKDSVNSSGAPEKHIPKVSFGSVPANPDLIMVEVVVPHVMVADPEKPHFIQAIWLKEEKTGDVAVAKVLPATEPSPPSLKCGVPKGAKLTPYLYCNLHGLWKGDTFTA